MIRLFCFSVVTIMSAKSFCKTKTVSCFTVLDNAMEYALSTGTYEPSVVVVNPLTYRVDSDNEDFDEERFDALDEMLGELTTEFEVFHVLGNSIITEERGPSSSSQQSVDGKNSVPQRRTQKAAAIAKAKMATADPEEENQDPADLDY